MLQVDTGALESWNQIWLLDMVDTGYDTSVTDWLTGSA
jgi:hypothetical protein